MATSCHPDKITSGQEVYNEVKNVDEIFGLFNLKLGVTTIKDLEKYYKSQESSYGELSPDYSFGVYTLQISDFTEKREWEKDFNNNTKVRQCYFSDYRYNEFFVSGLSVFFLEDVLVGMQVKYLSSSKGFSLYEDYKKKYGDGLGKKSWYYVMVWNPRINEYSFDGNRSISSEERVWKNAKIEVKYNGDSFNYALIEGYAKFDSLMKEAINMEMKKYNDSKSKKINSSI